MRYEVAVGSGRVFAEVPHWRGAARRADGTPVRLHVPANELRLVAP